MNDPSQWNLLSEITHHQLLRVRQECRLSRDELGIALLFAVALRVALEKRFIC